MEEGSGAGGGEWSWVSGGKKGKGKKSKKMKNARTLSLQTFFSEHGPQGQENGSDCGGGGPGSDFSGQDLTPEEALARESLLTYFSDLIRRSGPLKIDGTDIKTHLEERMADGDTLLNGRNAVELEQMPIFLAQSPDLIIVDDIVCERRHRAEAQSLALAKVLENFSKLSDNLKSLPSAAGAAKPTPPPPSLPPQAEVGGGPGGQAGPPTPAPAAGLQPPPANVWTKGPPGGGPNGGGGGGGGNAVGGSASTPASYDSSILQLPKVDSLFNGSQHSGFGGITGMPSVTVSVVPSITQSVTQSNATSVKLPDMSSPPPPLPPISSMTNLPPPPPAPPGLGCGVEQNSTGAIGVNRPPPPPPATTAAQQQQQHHDTVETLNRTLNRVTTYNTDLLDQLNEQERKTKAMSQKVGHLEKELVEAKEEIARLKANLASKMQMQADNSVAENNNANLILVLKKELESERLNSRNLQTQLEMERQHGKTVQDKHTSLINKLQNITGSTAAVTAAAAAAAAAAADSSSSSPSNSPSPAATVGGGGGGGVGGYSSFGDSFGLRGLLANTSPHHTFSNGVGNGGGSNDYVGRMTAQQLFNNPPPLPQNALPSMTSQAAVLHQAVATSRLHQPPNMDSNDLYNQFKRL